jgi:hypothetical protein
MSFDPFKESGGCASSEEVCNSFEEIRVFDSYPAFIFPFLTMSTPTYLKMCRLHKARLRVMCDTFFGDREYAFTCL